MQIELIKEFVSKGWLSKKEAKMTILLLKSKSKIIRRYETESEVDDESTNKKPAMSGKFAFLEKRFSRASKDKSIRVL